MTKLFTSEKDVTMTSVEGVIYKVIDGFVEVPWEAAKILMDGHGFTIASEIKKIETDIKTAVTSAKKG